MRIKAVLFFLCSYWLQTALSLHKISSVAEEGSDSSLRPMPMHRYLKVKNRLMANNLSDLKLPSTTQKVRCDSSRAKNGKKSGKGKKGKKGDAPECSPFPEAFAYCALDIDELVLVDEVIRTNVNDIDDFLDENEKVIEGLGFFVSLVTSIVPKELHPSDIAILEAIMVQNRPSARNLLSEVNSDDHDHPHSRELADFDADCTAALISVIVGVINLVLSVISPAAGSVANRVGNAVANRILVNNPNFYTFAILILRASSSTIEKVWMLFVELIANIGLGTFLDILAAELDWKTWGILVATLVIELTAILVPVTGPAQLALKLAKAGLSAAGLGLAFISFLENCEEEETPPPTRSPTLPPTLKPTAQPSPSPTRSPTLPPTLKPTAQPTLEPCEDPEDPCCGSEDPCCGSEDPCCGSSDSCCGIPDCGGSSGDPHMTTFDGLRYDCQGRGHFILTESGGMQIQARFRKQGRVSLTTGMAASEGPNSTVVEVSIPVTSGLGPVVLVNGTTLTTSPPTFEDSNVVVVSNSNNGPFRITYKDTALTVSCKYHVRLFFGRYFNCRVAIPSSYRAQGTQGLLGSADDNTLNDWMQPDGTLIPTPTTYLERRGNPALDYCLRYWCIREESAILFTYYDSDFISLSGCDEGLTDPVELAEATPELRALCGEDEACLIDGIEGGVEEAQTQLVEQADLAAAAAAGRFQISPANIAVNTNFNLAITVDISASGIPPGTVDEFNLYRVDDQGQPGTTPVLQLPATGNNIYSNLLAVFSTTPGEFFSFQAVAVIDGAESAPTFTKLNAVTYYSTDSGIGGVDTTPCGGSCEDGDLCTINTCDAATKTCQAEPVACGNGEACDSFTGLCQSLQNVVPCVAVIDEWDNRNYDIEWAEFRTRFPQRPFCLLVPNNSIQRLPTGYVLDTVNNPDGVDRTLALTVNRDNNNAALASNWFELCNLGALSPSSISFVGLFVDTSGSMQLSTVQASYDMFLTNLTDANLDYQRVLNSNEHWIVPFLTTLSGADIGDEVEDGVADGVKDEVGDGVGDGVRGGVGAGVGNGVGDGGDGV